MNLPNRWTLLVLSLLWLIGSAAATVETVEGEFVGTASLRNGSGGLQEALPSSSLNATSSNDNAPLPVQNVVHNNNIIIIEPPITDHDIEIMKKEIKWGRNEMKKYRAFRGAWPVRTNNNAGDAAASGGNSHYINVDETILRISKDKSPASYWEMIQVLSFF